MTDDNATSLKFRGSTLFCPSCGFDHLHQDTVTVRNRVGEDCPGVRVTIDGPSARLEPEVQFEGRRDDIAISFWCEGCGGEKGRRLILRVMQHKGQTFVYWDDASLVPEG